MSGPTRCACHPHSCKATHIFLSLPNSSLAMYDSFIFSYFGGLHLSNILPFLKHGFYTLHNHCMESFLFTNFFWQFHGFEINWTSCQNTLINLLNLYASVWTQSNKQFINTSFSVHVIKILSLAIARIPSCDLFFPRRLRTIFYPYHILFIPCCIMLTIKSVNF